MITEADWLASNEPYQMFKLAKRTAGERKIRLFSAACCRRVQHLLKDPVALEACDVVERYADFGLRHSVLNDWFSKVQQVWLRCKEHDVDYPERAACRALLDALDPRPGFDHIETHCEVIKAMASATGDELGSLKWVDAAMTEYHWLSALLREIVGNPFRPAAVLRGRVTDDVVELAGEIYECRTFERMPELADALVKVGCHDVEILGHCRRQEGHVRGCWVLDLVLDSQ
jgi:hypothetical protein